LSSDSATKYIRHVEIGAMAMTSIHVAADIMMRKTSSEANRAPIECTVVMMKHTHMVIKAARMKKRANAAYMTRPLSVNAAHASGSSIFLFFISSLRWPTCLYGHGVQKINR